MNGWKRLVAVGCTHGNYVNPKLRKFVLDFCDDFKPYYRVDLGDLIDTASFRAGARNTADEGKPLRPDLEAAISWISDYRPTHILWGNHDWRLWEHLDSPNAKIQLAAEILVGELTKAAQKVRAQTFDYTVCKNHVTLGQHRFVHGFLHSQNALRDTSFAHGCPVVMAHLHAPQQLSLPMVNEGDSFCVGTMCDRDSMHYAMRRYKTLSWGPGMVFGEVRETKTGGESKLWLAKGKSGELPNLPWGRQIG